MKTLEKQLKQAQKLLESEVLDAHFTFAKKYATESGNKVIRPKEGESVRIVTSDDEEVLSESFEQDESSNITHSVLNHEGKFYLLLHGDVFCNDEDFSKGTNPHFVPFNNYRGLRRGKLAIDEGGNIVFIKIIEHYSQRHREHLDKESQPEMQIDYQYNDAPHRTVAIRKRVDIARKELSTYKTYSINMFKGFDSLEISIAKRLDFLQTVYVAIQYMLLVYDIHDKGIVHRDLKPENYTVDTLDVMNDKLPKVSVIDFGMSKRFNHYFNEQGYFLIDNSSYSGTPGYISPNIKKNGYYCLATDMYAAAKAANTILENYRYFNHSFRQPELYDTIFVQFLNLINQYVIDASIFKEKNWRYLPLIDLELKVKLNLWKKNIEEQHMLLKKGLHASPSSRAMSIEQSPATTDNEFSSPTSPYVKGKSTQARYEFSTPQLFFTQTPPDSPIVKKVIGTPPRKKAESSGQSFDSLESIHLGNEADELRDAAEEINLGGLTVKEILELTSWAVKKALEDAEIPDDFKYKQAVVNLVKNIHIYKNDLTNREATQIFIIAIFKNNNISDKIKTEEDKTTYKDILELVEGKIKIEIGTPEQPLEMVEQQYERIVDTDAVYDEEKKVPSSCCFPWFSFSFLSKSKASNEVFVKNKRMSVSRQMN